MKIPAKDLLVWLGKRFGEPAAPAVKRTVKTKGSSSVLSSQTSFFSDPEVMETGTVVWVQESTLGVWVERVGEVVNVPKQLHTNPRPGDTVRIVQGAVVGLQGASRTRPQVRHGGGTPAPVGIPVQYYGTTGVVPLPSVGHTPALRAFNEQPRMQGTQTSETYGPLIGAENGQAVGDIGSNLLDWVSKTVSYPTAGSIGFTARNPGDLMLNWVGVEWDRTGLGEPITTAFPVEDTVKLQGVRGLDPADYVAESPITPPETVPQNTTSPGSFEWGYLQPLTPWGGPGSTEGPYATGAVRPMGQILWDNGTDGQVRLTLPLLDLETAVLAHTTYSETVYSLEDASELTPVETQYTIGTMARVYGLPSIRTYHLVDEPIDAETHQYVREVHDTVTPTALYPWWETTDTFEGPDGEFLVDLPQWIFSAESPDPAFFYTHGAIGRLNLVLPMVTPLGASTYSQTDYFSSRYRFDPVPDSPGEYTVQNLHPYGWWDFSNWRVFRYDIGGGVVMFVGSPVTRFVCPVLEADAVNSVDQMWESNLRERSLYRNADVNHKFSSDWVSITTFFPQVMLIHTQALQTTGYGLTFPLAYTYGAKNIIEEGTEADTLSGDFAILKSTLWDESTVTDIITLEGGTWTCSTGTVDWSGMLSRANLPELNPQTITFHYDIPQHPESFFSCYATGEDSTWHLVIRRYDPFRDNTKAQWRDAGLVKPKTTARYLQYLQDGMAKGKTFEQLTPTSGCGDFVIVQALPADWIYYVPGDRPYAQEGSALQALPYSRCVLPESVTSDVLIGTEDPADLIKPWGVVNDTTSANGLTAVFPATGPDATTVATLWIRGKGKLSDLQVTAVDTVVGTPHWVGDGNRGAQSLDDSTLLTEKGWGVVLVPLSGPNFLEGLTVEISGFRVSQVLLFL